MKKWYGYVLLLLTALIWGMAFSAQSAGMDHMGPFTFQSVRCFLGAFALLPVVLIRSRARAKKEIQNSETNAAGPRNSKKTEACTAGPRNSKKTEACTAGPRNSERNEDRTVSLPENENGDAHPVSLSENENETKNENESKKDRAAGFRKKLTGGLVCGTVLCVSCCLQQVGIKYTTVGKAGFLTALYVLLVPFIGLLVFRKTVPKKIYLCVVVATVGLYLLNSGSDGAGLNIGDMLCGLSAVGFAVHILVVDHFVQGIDGLELSCMQFFVSGILSGIPMLLLEAPAMADLIAGGLPLLYAGIVSCGVGYTLQIVGQKYVEPFAATLIMSLESVFAVVGGVLLLAQIPSASELAGCCLILAAVIYAQIPARAAAS